MNKALAKLNKIQQLCKVGKSVKNEFANFNYRTVDQIYEAVKPLCDQQNCTIIMSDKIELIGDRYYVSSTATIFDNDSDDSYSVSSYAREEQDRPKMCQAQVTGSCSTYARKYALGGLLLLDDNKDIDSMDNTKETKKIDMSKIQEINEGEDILDNKITSAQQEVIDGLNKELGYSPEEIKKDLKLFKVDKFRDLSYKQAENYIKGLSDRIKKRGK